MTIPPLLLLLRVVLFCAFALPWLLVFAPASIAEASLVHSIDIFFGGMCPRLPERTLTFWGEPMVLCSRCSGVFAGVALTALFNYPKLPKSSASNTFLLSGAAMLFDVVTQDLGLHPVWHLTRLATGVVVGASIWFVLSADARNGD